MIRVAIVEDRKELGESLSLQLQETNGFFCVGRFETGEAAVKRIPMLKPGVALVDLRLPKMQGVDCIRELKSRLPKMEILVLSVEEDIQKVFAALKAGASGYLVKRWSMHKVLAAIREVHDGGVPMSPQIARMVLKHFSNSDRNKVTFEKARLNQLTERENEVLRLVSQGYTDKEVAEKLLISSETVNAHLKSIYEKLHVRNRTAASAILHRQSDSRQI